MDEFSKALKEMEDMRIEPFLRKQGYMALEIKKIIEDDTLKLEVNMPVDFDKKNIKLRFPHGDHVQLIAKRDEVIKGKIHECKFERYAVIEPLYMRVDAKKAEAEYRNKKLTVRIPIIEKYDDDYVSIK
jgi:HSP20 family molecular chaperone IbpA